MGFRDTARRILVETISADYDAIAITETHHHPDDPDVPTIDTHPASHHQPYSKKTGGVSLFARPSIRPRLDLQRSCPDVCFAEIPGPADIDVLLVGTFYHRANDPGDHFQSILDCINSACATGMPLLLVGDFNAHHPAWQEGTTRDTAGRDLYDTILNNNLTIVNNLFPTSRNCITRVGNRSQRSSVLDLILTNIPNVWTSCTVLDRNYLDSDHFPVVITANRSSHSHVHVPPSIRVKWDFKNADWERFTSDMEDAYHTNTTHTINNILTQAINPLSNHQQAIEGIWSAILNMINHVALDTIPQTVIKTAAKPWWCYDKRLPSLLKAYRRAHRRWIRYKHRRTKPAHDSQQELYSDMNSARSAWRTAVRAAIHEKWNINCEKVDSSDTPGNGRTPNWRAFARTKRSKRTIIENIVDRNGHLPTNCQSAVNNMAEHLAEVCSIPDTLPFDRQHDYRIRRKIASITRNLSRHPVDECFFDADFTVEEVKSILDIANTNSALGPDFMPAQILRHASPGLVDALAKCINYSWRHGVLPIDWRRADVCILHKDGAPPNDPNSYRPISLTSLVVKAMERLVLRRILGRLGDKIYPSQAGFRPNHCTTDNLFYLWTAIQQKINDPNSEFGAAFIDFSKAFDKTWHNGLLYKAYQFGIKGKAWFWLKAFLSDRELRVVSNGYCSDWMPITAGVPQGAVISPLLFIIFINDISSCEEGLQILMYADDITLWHSDHNERMMNRILAALVGWSYKWQMCINGPKSGVMWFHRPVANTRPRPSHRAIIITLQNQSWYNVPEDGAVALPPPVTFNVVERYKYLGVIFTDSLSWKAHSLSVINKARFASRSIGRIIHRDRAPGILIIRLLVTALVIPIIKYGWPVWSLSPNTEIKLRHIIVAPLRAVLGLAENVHHDSVLHELAIPSIRNMYHGSVIAWYNRLRSLPASHFTRPFTNHLRWKWRLLHGRTVGTRLNAKIKTKLIARIIKALSALHLTTITHMNWNDNVWKKGNVRLLLLQASRRQWAEGDEGRVLRSLWEDIPIERPFMQPYLYHDSRTTVALRTRFRFNRTLLLQPRSRRGGLPNGATDVTCPLCHGDTDNETHYLRDCTHQTMIAARQAAMHTMWYPIYPSEIVHDFNDNSIIIFTDGSCINRNKAGAGALIYFPSRTRSKSLHILHSKLITISRTGPKRNPLINSIKVSHPASACESGYFIESTFSIPHGTNNIAELFAIGIGVDAVVNAIVAHPHEHWLKADIIIATDSKYCIGVFAKGHNIDRNHDTATAIYDRLQRLTNKGRRRIIFHWLRGHDGFAGNEYVDQLAKGAARSCDLKLIQPSIPNIHTLPVYTNANIHRSDDDHIHIPSVSEIMGVLPPHYGPLDIKRSLVATGHYLEQLYQVRRF